jgi:Amt family ammonium transporter
MIVFLSEIFSHFDQLVEKHNAERSETVGDSYMVPLDYPFSATIMRILPLPLISGLRKRHNDKRTGDKLPYRHQLGPDGRDRAQKISYRWGDTVNTPHGSHGFPGQIQISETTYTLIKGFHCELRGQIDVKGKGLMKTYLLKSRL